MFRRNVEIGQSVLGRPIMAVHFLPPGYARPRPPAVFVGAIRGDEPLGAYCLSRLCEELIERPPGRDTWIVPALNVDGLAGGSQNNARDVDLNRNFASVSWSAKHPPGCSSGPAAESEPETQALVALVERVGAERLVAVHSPYRMLLWDGQGQALAEEMAALNGYEVKAGAAEERPGSFGDRFGKDQNLEVVTLEIPFLEDEEAWQQNRAALRHAVDLPT